MHGIDEGGEARGRRRRMSSGGQRRRDESGWTRGGPIWMSEGGRCGSPETSERGEHRRRGARVGADSCARPSVASRDVLAHVHGPCPACWGGECGSDMCLGVPGVERRKLWAGADDQAPPFGQAALEFRPTAGPSKEVLSGKLQIVSGKFRRVTSLEEGETGDAV